VKFGKTVLYISYPATECTVKIDSVPNILYLWGKLISANIFRIYWPIKVEFGIEDPHVTPLCNCILKCINLMTISLVKIDIVKSILYFMGVRKILFKCISQFE